ncbi:hypothetical protein BESB_002970 [Besnoitia besnoiti]|uniref:Uncharacterized protein n=1 Tax=Besnoitia besnoiti TaxID=94643 RepID=A0A2A9MNV4_BESBE|nr:hypothetical protein BESB_002970 [Besnoitia besnoiti]PFH37956.1 hypothetical protein BESB_002970 [Besnoitia besnoiti]
MWDLRRVILGEACLQVRQIAQPNRLRHSSASRAAIGLQDTWSPPSASCDHRLSPSLGGRLGRPLSTSNDSFDHAHSTPGCRRDRAEKERQQEGAFSAAPPRLDQIAARQCFSSLRLVRTPTHGPLTSPLGSSPLTSKGSSSVASEAPAVATRLDITSSWIRGGLRQGRHFSTTSAGGALADSRSTGVQEDDRRTCGYSVSQFVRACAEVLDESQLRRVAIRLVEYKNLKRQKPNSRDAAIRAIKRILPGKYQDSIAEHLARCIDVVDPDQFHRLAKLARARHCLADDFHESVPQSRLSDYTSAARFLTKASSSKAQTSKKAASAHQTAEAYEALCDVGDVGVAATADGLVRQVARRPPAPTRMQDKRVGEFLVHIEDPSIPAAGSTTDRLVFISNIPHGPRKQIRKAIKEAFMGCGKIVNLEIFDDRLRTVDERDELSLQKRGAKASADKLRGRFSPIFAIAEFDTAEAKRRACSTFLRIFGVPCIDRLLYVEDAADKKTLVASNLPFGLAADEIARILAYALACDRSASSVPASVCRIEMTNPHVYGYKDLIVEARSDCPRPYFVSLPEGVSDARRDAAHDECPIGSGASLQPSLSGQEATCVDDCLAPPAFLDESPMARLARNATNDIQLPSYESAGYGLAEAAMLHAEGQTRHSTEPRPAFEPQRLSVASFEQVHDPNIAHIDMPSEHFCVGSAGVRVKPSGSAPQAGPGSRDIDSSPVLRQDQAPTMKSLGGADDAAPGLLPQGDCRPRDVWAGSERQADVSCSSHVSGQRTGEPPQGAASWKALDLCSSLEHEAAFPPFVADGNEPRVSHASASGGGGTPSAQPLSALADETVPHPKLLADQLQYDASSAQSGFLPSEPSDSVSLFSVTVSRTGDLNEETFFPEEKSDCLEEKSSDVSDVLPVLRHDQDMANVVLQKFLTDRLNAQNDGLFVLRFASFEAAAVAIRKCRGTVLFDRRALLIFSPRRCVAIDGQLVDLPLR